MLWSRLLAAAGVGLLALSLAVSARGSVGAAPSAAPRRLLQPLAPAPASTAPDATPGTTTAPRVTAAATTEPGGAAAAGAAPTPTAVVAAPPSATTEPPSSVPASVVVPAPDQDAGAPRDLLDVDPVTARLAGTLAARERVVSFALSQAGKPYVFGADGPAAFDCSGLALAAYARVGVTLPHAAAWQAEAGHAVAWWRDDIRPGDLVFVRGGRPPHDLGHVGIAISATEWVRASHPGGAVEVGPLPFGRIQAVRRLLG